MAQERRRIKLATFEERLAEDAIKFKEAAEKQPHGSTARELLLRRARQAETPTSVTGYGPLNCSRQSKTRSGEQNDRRLLHWRYRRRSTSELSLPPSELSLR